MAGSNRIEALVLEVLDRYDCDLVLMTFRREKGGFVLRILFERRGADPNKGSGVDLKLCSVVSRDIGAAIDASQVIDYAYTLEVSSPGIERPLVKPKDFERFNNRTIFLKTRRAIEGHRRFRGRLLGFGNGHVNMQIDKGEPVAIPFDNVEKANLVFEPNGFGANAGD